MSYSFSVKAATKAEVIQKVSAEMDKVVASMPAHQNDRADAEAAVLAFVGLIRDLDDKSDVAVSVNGSIWKSDNGIQSVNFGVSASAVPKTA